jgi:ABC-2 type transport system permease protein
MRVIRAFLRRAFKISFIYRLDFWLSMLGIFVMMYGTYSIWSVLYKQSPNAFGVNVEQMRTYGVLGVLLMLIMESAMETQYYIAEQVRQGTLELDLLKPLDFMFHMFSNNVGTLGVMLLTWFLPGLTFAFLVLDFQPPAGAGAALGFVASLFLGYLVFFFANFIVGLLSIVTLDIRSYAWAYNSVVRFVSGQIVPLWMFPGPLAAIVGVLPFQAVFFVPMAIYIGAYEGTILGALTFQAAWALGLFLAGRLFWARVQRRIAIQGG